MKFIKVQVRIEQGIVNRHVAYVLFTLFEMGHNTQTKNYIKRDENQLLLEMIFLLEAVCIFIHLVYKSILFLALYQNIQYPYLNHVFDTPFIVYIRINVLHNNAILYICLFEGFVSIDMKPSEICKENNDVHLFSHFYQLLARISL